MNGSEFQAKFCSKERITKYKKIIKAHFENFNSCLAKSEYHLCTKKHQIVFPVTKYDRTSCYDLSGDKKKTCYKLFDKDKLAEAEELLFQKLGKEYFDNVDLFLSGTFNCIARPSGSYTINGKDYRGHSESIGNELKYTGNLFVSLNREDNDNQAEKGMFLLGTHYINFLHKDKSPGEYNNFQGVEPEDVENFSMNFSGPSQ